MNSTVILSILLVVSVFAALTAFGVYALFQSTVAPYRGRVVLDTNILNASCTDSLWEAMAIKAAYKERISGHTNKVVSLYKLNGLYIVQVDTAVINTGKPLIAYLKVLTDEEVNSSNASQAPQAKLSSSQAL